MRKHLSTLFEKGNEIFRGSSSECRKEMCRILAAKGVFQYRGKFYDSKGHEVEVCMVNGIARKYDLEIVADNKRKKK